MKVLVCLLTLLLTLLLTGFAGNLARAQEDPPPKVKVTLVVILASEKGKNIDKALTAIAEEVQAINPNFTSFKLKSMECKSMAKDEKAELKTVEGQKVQFVLRECANKKSKVCLAVTAPDQGEIVYESICGKFLPIITRYETKNQERLILAIRVMPCKGE